MKINYLHKRPINEWEDFDDMNINTIEDTLNKDIKSQISSDFDEILYNTLIPKFKDLIYNTIKKYYIDKLGSSVGSWKNLDDDFDIQCSRFCMVSAKILTNPEFEFNVTYNNNIFNLSLPITILDKSWNAERLIFNSASNFSEDSIYRYDIYTRSKTLLALTDLIIKEIKDKLKLKSTINYLSIDSHIQFSELDSTGLSYNDVNIGISNFIKVLNNIKNFNDIKDVDYLILKKTGKGLKTPKNSLKPKNINTSPFAGLKNSNVIKLLNMFNYNSIEFDNSSSHLLNQRNFTSHKNGLENELYILNNIKNLQKGYIKYSLCLRYIHQPSDSLYNSKEECEYLYNTLISFEEGLEQFIDKEVLLKKLKDTLNADNYEKGIPNTVFYYNNPLKDITFKLGISFDNDPKIGNCGLSLEIPKMNNDANYIITRPAKYKVYL